MLARRALDLFSAEAIIALQVLVAVRTGKLEVAHGGNVAGNPGGRQMATLSKFCRAGGPDPAANGR
jgi:hypothetical protein